MFELCCTETQLWMNSEAPVLHSKENSQDNEGAMVLASGGELDSAHHKQIIKTLKKKKVAQLTAVPAIFRGERNYFFLFPT